MVQTLFIQKTNTFSKIICRSHQSTFFYIPTLVRHYCFYPISDTLPIISRLFRRPISLHHFIIQHNGNTLLCTDFMHNLNTAFMSIGVSCLMLICPTNRSLSAILQRLHRQQQWMKASIYIVVDSYDQSCTMRS